MMTYAQLLPTLPYWYREMRRDPTMHDAHQTWVIKHGRYVYVCVCMCMYVYVYVCMSSVCVCARMMCGYTVACNVYVCTHVYVCTRVHARVCMHAMGPEAWQVKIVQSRGTAQLSALLPAPLYYYPSTGAGHWT